MNIGLGDPDATWRQYGLLQYPVVFDNEDTQYKAIVRDGSLVKILGVGYELFPNEEALKQADQVAALVGLEPFSVSAPGLRTEGHVIFNEEETRMRAVYTLWRVERVDGDEVNVGVNVFNSIDGSSSFGARVGNLAHSNRVHPGTPHRWRRHLPGEDACHGGELE